MRSLVDELEIEARHADHMASMADYWMRRAIQAERTCGVLIAAAGGEITVHLGDLARTSALTVTREEVPRELTVRFRAQTKDDSGDGQVQP